MEIDEKPAYYSILPASVRYDKTLSSSEKILYSEITSLANKTGVCTAQNGYFSNLYGKAPETISRWVNNLKNRQYIDVEFTYLPGTKAIDKRIIKINDKPVYEIVDTSYQNSQEGIDENVKDNNTSINNIKENINNINIINIKEKNKNFKKPTIQELIDYCLEQGYGIDVGQFYDYYESKGWLVGKSPMKNWKAAVNNWHRNSKKVKSNESNNNISSSFRGL